MCQFHISPQAHNTQHSTTSRYNTECNCIILCDLPTRPQAHKQRKAVSKSTGIMLSVSHLPTSPQYLLQYHIQIEYQVYLYHTLWSAHKTTSPQTMEGSFKMNWHHAVSFTSAHNPIIHWPLPHLHGVRDKLYFVIWPKSIFFFGNGTLTIYTS
jgi:hypothetical protein